ncbi:MAG: OmpA family protein [Alphaproteobacteria bacterium]|nr:OmpA family protein [Alphaproteobacteria bacterium]
MRIAIALAACAALLVSACQTQDPYTGEQKTSHATRGAIFGALGGAAIGALTNTSSGKQAARNALIGAGIGALAGGAIGGYMDNQEAELRQRLRAAGVSVQRQGNNIVLVMASDITFPVDGDQVNPQFYQTLAAVGEVLAEYNKTTIEVSGHTDSTGANQYNQDLSQRRANSVAYVLSQNGVMPQRMYVIGLGETRPVASNATPAGRAKNRRVEIQIVPYTS